MTENEFRLTRIGVVMLGVKDLARSIEFYGTRLGLALQNQIPGFAFFDGGGVTLALSEPVARALPEGPRLQPGGVLGRARARRLRRAAA
jgi:catechol 2,3-dioxygenase-like lactoylglutathione lyase family enzyme